jgi:flagellar biosynthetic protein FliR
MIENLTFHQCIVFFIGFVRIATIVATVPIFGYYGVPVIVKAGFSFFITWVLYPLIDSGTFTIPVDFLPFVLMVMKEVFIGLIIGLASNFLFIGLQMAGELIGIDMGFGIVNIIDPMSGEQVSLMSQFQYIVAILLFIILNGHHFLLNALRSSFVAVPLGSAHLSGLITAQIARISADIFKIALQIGGPAIVVLFMTSFVMGIIARTVPQMNIFIVGFPLKISVGLAMVWVSLPLFGYVFEKLFDNFQESIVGIIQVMR